MNSIMKQCVKCGTENAVNALFCKKCGAPLPYKKYGVRSDQGGSNSGVTPTSPVTTPPVTDHSDVKNIPPLFTTPSSTNISFLTAIRICLKEKFLCFRGRASRAEYWYFVLFSLIVTFVVVFVGSILGAVFFEGDDEACLGLVVILMGIVSLAMICPGLSVLIRRLHDTGRSGWWYFICFIPWIGSIVLLVLVCLGSQEYDNKYGPYIK